ncbi:DUF5060 domain-containing protein [Luteolibacter luteus]|uniref:DUF5060 domain-containing protein n=1 Tax=Luteolibacter luteus TaxID=2728835 RepID=UPI00197B654C|nr:DUF5060 domain-containing protein [Luteolibacter luteus]
MPGLRAPRLQLTSWLVSAVASACFAATAGAQQQAVPVLSGELRMWHKLTLDFAGPWSSETADPNPFTAYRLDVTFIHSATGRRFSVPGYYAADGNAANTSADSGNVWRAHFAPDAAGVWTYIVSFRSGPNVAMEPDRMAGQSAGFCDGESGSFAIMPTDKTGRDMRAKGRLDYTGIHHLRFAGTGEYFMKAGTDSPENLLAYADFDGPFKDDDEKDELVKTWQPHVADWQEGDPSWQNGKGKGLIGAINYLASEGLNCFSFLTMNVEGDDRNVFPYLNYGERLRMDVSRLDQWEIVFEHSTNKGMFLHFKTQETENERMLDNGNTGNQRRLYYRELIARFSHHLAMQWNLGEEINDASLEQKASWARFFHDNDPYRHPIVIHNGANHFEMMGEASLLTGFSLQLNESNFGDTFLQTLRYVKRSADFNRPWVIGTDEPGDSRSGVRPDDDPGNSHRDARKDALWANVMAGGGGCEFYFGYERPEGDLTLQNFRSRDAFWDYLRHMLVFFAENPFPFEQMGNHNELVSGHGENANRCLARIGDTYLVQLRSGGLHTLDLTGVAGRFAVEWFNPRAGGPLTNGGSIEGGDIVSLGAPPDTPGEDWIVLVRNPEGGSATNRAPNADAGPDKSAFMGDHPVSLTLHGTASDDGLPGAFALSRAWSVVSGPAPVSFSSAQTAITIATFNAPGRYVLGFTVTDTEFTAYDEVKVYIEVPQTGLQSLLPANDSFLEDGTNENGEHLGVQAMNPRRIAYLQFDLTGLSALPSHAKLRLTEAGQPADMEITLRLYGATGDDWSEASLDGTNAPLKKDFLGSFKGRVPKGSPLEFDLGSYFTERRRHTLILESETLAGAVSFASKEHPLASARPVLFITLPPNTAPQFRGFSFTTSEDLPVTLSHREILAGATDAEGDPLLLLIEDGSTSAGGQIISAEGSFTYTPSIDYLGPDSFLLTVQDIRGASASAILHITVIADGLSGVVPFVEKRPDGTFVQFNGHAGFGYFLQRSGDLVNWTTLTPMMRTTEGRVEYMDRQAPGRRSFYRVSDR